MYHLLCRHELFLQQPVPLRAKEVHYCTSPQMCAYEFAWEWSQTHIVQDQHYYYYIGQDQHCDYYIVQFREEFCWRAPARVGRSRFPLGGRRFLTVWFRGFCSDERKRSYNEILTLGNDVC